MTVSCKGENCEERTLGEYEGGLCDKCWEKKFLCSKCGSDEFYASERTAWDCKVNTYGALICTKPDYCGDFEVECAKCGKEIKVNKFNGVEFK